jgi:adenosylhomocysteine nucleosidase
MREILIMAALPEEADALWPGVGDAAQVRHIPVRRLQASGLNITIGCTGIGKVNAALAAGLVMSPSCDLILMSGTCGRIAGGAQGQSGAHWITHAVQHDYGALHADGLRPYRAGNWPMGPAGPQHFSPIADPGLGLPHAGIVSGDVFLQCEEAAARLAVLHNAALIDMEVAAIAQAAAALGLPWAAIKAVTDDANAESAGDFSINLKKAARQAAIATEQLIARI